MSNEYPIGFQIPEHNLKLAIVLLLLRASAQSYNSDSYNSGLNLRGRLPTL